MTEFYDADHGVSELDRARAEALRASNERGDGWGNSYEDIVEQLMAQVGQMLNEMGVEATGGKALATKEEFLKELDLFLPTEEDIAEESSCAVCMCAFTADDHMNELPCNHLFHPDCLHPWLKTHNTCPVCRHILPSDDPRYEEEMAKKAAEKDKEAELEKLHGGMYG